MTSTDHDTAGWRRLGTAIRTARTARFGSRDAFADYAGTSVRVLADLEHATRANFTERILARVETALGWPAGTVSQILADPGFTPQPQATAGTALMFRAPVFDRTPVGVPVASIETAIAVMAADPHGPTTEAGAALYESLLALCLPAVIRLAEDNADPGAALHPGARPLYNAFTARAAVHAPDTPAVPYLAWLVGDGGEVPESVQQGYQRRWRESRKARPGVVV